MLQTFKSRPVDNFLHTHHPVGNVESVSELLRLDRLNASRHEKTRRSGSSKPGEGLLGSGGSLSLAILDGGSRRPAFLRGALAALQIGIPALAFLCFIILFAHIRSLLQLAESFVCAV